jgi:hypothetical protein
LPEHETPPGSSAYLAPRFRSGREMRFWKYLGCSIAPSVPVGRHPERTPGGHRADFQSGKTGINGECGKISRIPPFIFIRLSRRIQVRHRRDAFLRDQTFFSYSGAKWPGMDVFLRNMHECSRAGVFPEKSGRGGFGLSPLKCGGG